MYSLIATFSGIAFIILVAIMIFLFRKKITSLISWLQVFFCMSFFACIFLMLYYTHYYLGESQLLQKIYFGLFYLSIFLLLLIIGLRFLRYLRPCWCSSPTSVINLGSRRERK